MEILSKKLFITEFFNFRERCPFRVYMRSKPDRYGIKIWANCENPSGYVWNKCIRA